MNDNSVSNHSHTIVSCNLTLLNVTSCNSTNLTNLKGFSYFNCTYNFLFELRLKHSFHCFLDIVDSVIDDRVVTYFYSFSFSKQSRICSRSYLEGYYNGI